MLHGESVVLAFGAMPGRCCFLRVTRGKQQTLGIATNDTNHGTHKRLFCCPLLGASLFGFRGIAGLTLLSPCYTEKAANAWQRRGTQKTRNTYNQPNRPNRQTSQTKHQALPKGQPGRRITTINTAAVHASAQQPTISTHTRQGHHKIFSANAARCEAQAQYRRAG